jgi:uncharacterized protein YxjI
MNTYYLLKQKIIVNNQRFLVDNNDKIVYQFKSNIFQTRFKLIKEDNSIVSNITQKFRFRRQYVVHMSSGLLINIKSSKLFFHRSSDKVKIDGVNQCLVQGDIDKMHFRINLKGKDVLVVEPIKDKKKYRRILVLDDKLENMLISIFFTIILVFDHAYANN